MRRPDIEEFKRLAGHPAACDWETPRLDVAHLCDYILHLEAQNASMRRTFGSDPIFNEKAAEIGNLTAIIREILAVMDNEERTPEEMLLLERASDAVNK